MTDIEALNRLLAQIRPRLHRYCTRMMGSSFEGEDVVQETFARAIAAAPAAGDLRKPESWLFSIAHRAALDALRRRQRQAEVPFEEEADGLSALPDPTAAAHAAEASLATLMRLPPLQRSVLILGDVLEYSLAESVEILGSTLPAVKAALHRARAQLKQLAGNPPNLAAPLLPAAELARLRDYATRFNARDFDALRELLAEDVRLELVNRRRITGRREVGVYFTRYADRADWQLTPGLAEGRPALLVGQPGDASQAVQYVVLLDWQDGQISTIRDFFYAQYVTADLQIVALPA